MLAALEGPEALIALALSFPSGLGKVTRSLKERREDSSFGSTGRPGEAAV